VLDVDVEDFENYYFSGLSFSIEPLAEMPDTDSPYSIELLSFNRDTVTVKQTCISLRLFKKSNDGNWVLNNRARLPKIEHGSDENSVLIHELTSSIVDTDTIDTDTIDADKAIIRHIQAEETILAPNIGTSANPITNMVAKNLTADDLTIGDSIRASEFYIIKDVDYKVPYISVVEQGSEWQLQINNVNKSSS
jgi:hypothetical protein